MSVNTAASKTENTDRDFQSLSRELDKQFLDECCEEGDFRAAKRLPSYFDFASQKEINDLETFFISYGASTSLILTRKVPTEGGKHYAMRNYFFPVTNSQTDVLAIDNMKKIVLQRNTYITVAPRWCSSGSYPKRQIQNIRLFDRIVVDIDPKDHRRPFSKWDLRSIAEAMSCFDPAPFAIVFTGRGVQIHFLLQPEMAVYHYKWPYNHLVGILCEEVGKQLDDFHIEHGNIDKLTINALCRLPGTYNTAARNYASISYMNYSCLIPQNRISIQELMARYGIEDRQYRGKKKKKKKKKKSKAKKTKSKNTAKNSLPARMKRLYTALADTLIVQGCRNKAIFAYAYNLFCCLGYDNEVVFDMAEELNDLLADPLDNDELRNTILSASRQAAARKTFHGLISQLRWIGINIDDVDKSLLESKTEGERREDHRKAAKRYADKQKVKRVKVKKSRIEKTYKAFLKIGTVLGTARFLGMSRNTVRKYIRVWATVLRNHIKNSISFLLSLRWSNSVDFITGSGASAYLKRIPVLQGALQE